ncbi:MAG: flippase [Clostridia bacterium]|nr:flippase [Clostridia bacterium]
MKKSIAKNYIYNLIYQMLSILLPIITTPYLSRVLGAENIGIYGYTISIVTYFILFGTLGISMYGQREIAYKAQNKRERSRTFFEIIIVRAITLSISIITFYIIFGRTGDYAIYYRILIIQLVANLFDISWLFQGIEEFDKTVIRNLVIKLLSLVMIFVLVKTPDDLWKYFLIYVGAELIGNLTLWLYLSKYLEKVSFKEIKLKKHLKPAISLFIPQIAIQIYTVLDKTMIGAIMNNMEKVGYYEQAQKIVKSALTVVTALQTVMNSRIANAYINGDKDEVKLCLEKSFNFVWILAVPMMFGLIAIAPKFVPWFYGNGFDEVTPILISTAPILIVLGLNGVTGTQYLVQVKKQKEFTISVTIGAIVNIVLNLILINFLGVVGASVASVLAETAVLGVQLKYFKDQFSILQILKLGIKCFISGIVMYMVVHILVNFLNVSILNTIIEIIIGGIVYILTLIILKHNFFFDLANQIVTGISMKLRKVSHK